MHIFSAIVLLVYNIVYYKIWKLIYGLLIKRLLWFCSIRWNWWAGGKDGLCSVRVFFYKKIMYEWIKKSGAWGRFTDGKSKFSITSVSTLLVLYNVESVKSVCVLLMINIMKFYSLMNLHYTLLNFEWEFKHIYF